MAKKPITALDSLPLDLVETLLGRTPSAPFFVKDTDLRYVAANEAMLRLCGVRRRRDFIGKTARDFFPDPAWRRYEALDQAVLKTARPIEDRLDLVLSHRQSRAWLLFGRWPVMSAKGSPVGVAAIARSLPSPDRRHPTYVRLATAVADMQANFHRDVHIGTLARKAGVSVSQFERDFAALFGVAPRRYLMKLRIEAAVERLSGSASIAEIALEIGYSDQSAFTRRFVAAVGLTPTQYRARARVGQDVRADTEERE